MSAISAGPPKSASDPHFDVTESQVEQYREQGFLSLDRITTDAEVAWLSEVWDELFADRRRWFDVARPFGANDSVIAGQMLFPERLAPCLSDTIYIRSARRIATKLLGLPANEVESWGHMIVKPARVGRATPWHQDESYWEAELDYHAVGAWMPLEDVDGRNGCMCFVPGSHRSELLAHRHVDYDARLHMLEVDSPVDVSRAVEVPLRAGGVTFHHPRTLHATASNVTDRPRRSFAMEFQSAPATRAVPREKPWLDEQRRVWIAHRDEKARARATDPSA